MTTKNPGADSPILLAFSGGLDTSFLVPWLRETHGRPVITLTVDTGGIDAAAAAVLEQRSRELGAIAHHLVDARATYFDQVLRFLIMGNVRRGQLYPLCVGAERAIQAQVLAQQAARLGTGTVAHGCTAAGNDQVRFEVALRTLAPGLEQLAPVRDQAFKRPEQLKFLQDRGLPVPPFGAAYSVNRGLWGVTIGGTETLTSSGSIPEQAWVLSKGALDQPRPAERHVVGFERGIPCSVDGASLDPVAVIEKLESLAAPFGIGRGIHLGDTIIGTKGRVAFEAPAATILLTAHRELEKLVLAGFSALQCRDYARMDVRLRNGIFYLVDVNPNADISADASVARGAAAAGLSYGELISYLVTWLAFQLGSYVLVFAALTGFVFLAPVVAIGLYEISRQVAAGQTPMMIVSLLLRLRERPISASSSLSGCMRIV